MLWKVSERIAFSKKEILIYGKGFEPWPLLLWGGKEG